MYSERDSPLKRLYRRTHVKLTRLAGFGQLVWAAGCELSLPVAHARRPAWPGETFETILRVALPRKNAAARSHTSELTRGGFCFQVSTGGRHRWVMRVQVGRQPARQKAWEGYPSHYTSLITCITKSHQIWQPKFWLPNLVLYQTVKFQKGPSTILNQETSICPLARIQNLLTNDA